MAVQAATQASKSLLANFGKLKEVRQKTEETDIVTNADLESEKAILSLIKENFPGHGIISEESSPVQGKDFTWIIDPLDGTFNYSRQLPFYAVSIALAKKDEIVLGVVALPFSNEVFVAEKGKGCLLNGVKTSVSKRTMKEGYFSISSCLPVRKFSEINSMGTNTIPAGVASLAFLAAGRFEIVGICDHAKYWDFPAGYIVAKEAGAIATDWSGKPWDLNSKNLLATNGICHKEAMEIIEGK